MSIYYVSTLGNDSTGNGGPATPWATPQKAASVMVAGDTCNILGGTYNGRIRPTASGTSSAWITFQAYPVGAAVFDRRLHAGGYGRCLYRPQPGGSNMSIYYVAKFGSDSNNGGPATPWLTINHAAHRKIGINFGKGTIIGKLEIICPYGHKNVIKYGN